jgi:1-acyl-sn-glycerol-3-phosphate acyltransferase
LGEEQLKKFKHGILVSNHLGLYDIPVLFTALPISYRMAAKAELFRIPIFGAALRRAGFISIPRQDPVAAKKAVDQSLKHFKKGYSFWMAPEGTRFHGEGVGPFKMGAFALALQTGELILPICLYGPQLVLPKKSLWINVRAPVTEVFVSILPPIDPKGFEWETRHALKDLVREKIETEFFRLKSVAENKTLR